MSVTVRSLPSVLLIGMFVYPVLTDSYLPFTSRELLGVIVQIEWLVLATGLLLLFAMLVPTTTRIGKCIALAYVLIVSMGFALTGALEMDGWRGFIAYFSKFFPFLNKLFILNLQTLLILQISAFSLSLFLL